MFGHRDSTGHPVRVVEWGGLVTPSAGPMHALVNPLVTVLAAAAALGMPAAVPDVTASVAYAMGHVRLDPGREGRRT